MYWSAADVSRVIKVFLQIFPKKKANLQRGFFYISLGMLQFNSQAIQRYTFNSLNEYSA
jgi:hypothetical protein